MKNRNLINTKLEQLEGKMETLRYLATQGKDIEEYFGTLNQSKDLIEDLKTLISTQEITPDEFQ